MIQTAVFAAVAASAILLGAVLGAYWDPPDRLKGALLAFAAGALITALAFELFQEADREAGLWIAAGAFVAGATVFTVSDLVLEWKVGEREEAVGLALVAAVTLDGVPENLALGITLADGGSYALLVAIFASNFPEALGGSASIRADEGPARAVAIWVLVAVLLVVGLVGGRFLATGASSEVVGILLAFAAGAVLASIADTVLPEAFSEGGPLIAFATTAGFLVAYGLAG